MPNERPPKRPEGYEFLDMNIQSEGQLLRCLVSELPKPRFVELLAIRTEDECRRLKSCAIHIHIELQSVRRKDRASGGKTEYAHVRVVTGVGHAFPQQHQLCRRQRQILIREESRQVLC